MSNPNNTGDRAMTHAVVDLPKPNTHSGHPFTDSSNHAKLLEYALARVTAGIQQRDGEIPRLVNIDKGISGWMKLSPEDKQRAREKRESGAPFATLMNLPLGFVHVDDMMTYFAETFAPSRGMFYHTGNPAETDEAIQIITKMNNDAIYAGFYREVLRGIYSCLKYNSGGFEVRWAKEMGPRIDQSASGEMTIEYEDKWAGNRLRALDRYNYFHDPAVPASEVYKDGEFSGVVHMKSHYWLQSRAAQGTYYNCKKALKDHTGIAQCKYYRSPPREAEIEADESRQSTGGTDWVSVLSESDPYTQANGFELVEIYLRLNPTEFGLIEESAAKSRNRYELWRFTILNGEFIIETEWMNNAHGHIPHYNGVVNDDSMGAAQKSVAEILQPLQDFASFLMNLHIQANRSAVWGTTYYDPTKVDYGAVPPGEVAARVPIKPAGYGQDVRTFIHESKTNLDTKQTMGDLESLMGIINQFFPTQALPSQIASIDRAVSNQVAAVQHGANRRQQKTARLLDDSIFSKIRYAMYYNIIQYMPSDTEEITDYYTGKPIQIDLSKMRNTNLPFIIGQGLKAIDRMAVAEKMQNIIFALIQAPQAAQGIDLLAMIDYWTSMIDVDINMKQFRLQEPGIGDNGGPPLEDEEGAGAAGGINPATSAAAIAGGPIYD